MNRFSFRAWDKNSNTMLYKGDNNWTESQGDILNNFEDEDIMQSTGLKDKLGKEIFCGDKITYKEKIFEVKWCNGAFKLMEMVSMFEGAVDGWLHELFTVCDCDCQHPHLEIEIIGNIYSDLLPPNQNVK